MNLTLKILVCKTDHLVVKRRHQIWFVVTYLYVTKRIKRKLRGNGPGEVLWKNEMNLVQRAWREALRKINCRPRGVEPDGHGLYVNTASSHCPRSLRTLCLHLKKEFSTRKQWWIYDSQLANNNTVTGTFTVHLKMTNLPLSITSVQTCMILFPLWNTN